MDDFFKEVKAAFPIYPIPSFDLVYGYKISSEESYEELILLEGKEWTLIESNYLQNHYTFPFWLSISGLHYYLPAIMIFSWNEYMNKKDIVLVADSAALALGKFNDYSIYTNPQLNILIKWAGTLNFEI